MRGKYGKSEKGRVMRRLKVEETREENNQERDIERSIRNE